MRVLRSPGVAAFAYGSAIFWKGPEAQTVLNFSTAVEGCTDATPLYEHGSVG
jgi:hypothetical protein